MNLWSVEHNVEHFLTIFVITFGWVQQQSNTKPTGVFNWSEVHLEKKYYLLNRDFNDVFQRQGPTFQTVRLHQLCTSSQYWLVEHCQYQSYNLFVLGTRHGNDCFANLSMNHMFYMAFENSICDDYATEKFHRSLLYPVVPVVMGGANYKVEYWKLWNFK